MKSKFFVAAGVCLGALLAVGTQPVSAQILDLVKVTIPFTSMVGTTTLPAGDYTIRDIEDYGGGAILEFSSVGGHTVAALATRISLKNGGPAPRTELVVHNEGDTHHVQEIWMAGREQGFELLSAK